MASSDVYVLLVYKQTFVSGSVKEVFWPVVADQEARISGVHCVLIKGDKRGLIYF